MPPADVATHRRRNTLLILAGGLLVGGGSIAWYERRETPSEHAAAVSALPTLHVQPRSPGPIATVAVSEGVSKAIPATSVALEPKEIARRAFIRRLNTADARNVLGPGIPLDIARLTGEGELRAAADALLQIGRDGDANGYYALEQLLGSCPGPGDDPLTEQQALDRKARNYQMMRSLRDSGGSEELVEHLQWSLDAGNAYYRGIWKEFCPSRGEGDYLQLIEEIRRTLPDQTPPQLAEAMRKRTVSDAELNSLVHASTGELQARHRQRAAAGVIEEQIGLAMEQLGHGTNERASGIAMLRSLSSVSPDAAARLARFVRRNDLSEDAARQEALALALQAARGGSAEAWSLLAGDAASRPTLIEDAAERYAWSQVEHELQAQGCYGFSRFSQWAFRRAVTREAALRAMSPREAELARRRAAELLSTEVPAISRTLGCD